MKEGLIMEKTKVFHVVFVFYEKKDELGNYNGISRIDIASKKDNEVEALKECVEKAKALATSGLLTHKGDKKTFYFAETMVVNFE